MKAASVREEMGDAASAISLLGGEMNQIEHFLLPIEDSERNIVFINKKSPSPKKYPRKPGTPNRTPIK